MRQVGFPSIEEAMPTARKYCLNYGRQWIMQDPEGRYHIIFPYTEHVEHHYLNVAKYRLCVELTQRCSVRYVERTDAAAMSTPARYSMRHIGGGVLALYDGHRQVREVGGTPNWDFKDRDEVITRYNDYRGQVQDTDTWESAIVDEIVTCHIEASTVSETPRQLLHRIIEWHTKVALDPAVSQDARDLIRLGKAQAQPEDLARWFTPAVQTWLAVLDERERLDPDALKNETHRVERGNANALARLLINLLKGSRELDVPDDVVERCHEYPLDKLLTCAMEVHARSCRYGTRLQWEAAQAYKQEILNRFDALTRKES